MNHVLKLTLALCLLPALSGAAVIKQTEDSTNTENWDAAALWGGSAPTAGNSYNTNGHTLVVFGTEIAGSPNQFGGDSLILSSGSTLQTRGSIAVSYWSANLVLAGGELGTTLGNNAKLHMGGTIAVTADTTLRLTSSRQGFAYIFDGVLSGSNRLVLTGGNATGNSLVINNSASTFNGTFEIWSSNRLVFGYDYVGSDAVIRLAGSNSVLNLDRNIAVKSLILNNTEVDLVAGNTYTYAQLVALNAALATRLLDGGGTLTIIPEPGAAGLIGLLVAGLFVCRAHRRMDARRKK